VAELNAHEFTRMPAPKPQVAPLEVAAVIDDARQTLLSSGVGIDRAHRGGGGGTTGGYREPGSSMCPVWLSGCNGDVARAHRGLELIDKWREFVWRSEGAGLT